MATEHGMDAATRQNVLWIARAMAHTDLTPLRADDLVRLEQVVRVRTEPPGTVLMSAGSRVDAVYVVRRGRIRLATRRPVGGRQLVGLIREGGVIGDIPLFCDQPMPFDALVGDHTTVLEIPRDRLLALLEESSALALRWMTSLAKRLEQTQRRMVALLTKDLTMQVALLLLEERERDGAGRWVVHLSHGTIAQLLGVRRQSVSRVLGAMRDDGLVAGGYRAIDLLDPQQVAARAGTILREPPV